MMKDYNSRASNSSQEDKNRREERYGLVRYRPGAIIILVLLLILCWLYWTSLRPKPAIECVTFEDPTLTMKEIPREAPFLVRDQVIVIGPISAVDDVVDKVRADPTLNLEPIRKCDFHYLDSDKLFGQEDPKPQRFPFLGDARGVTMHLYHISSGQPVTETEVVKAINDAGGGQVFADPNLLIGNSASVCGNPEHSDGGSPFGPPKLLPVGEEAAVKLFWEQWAFDAIDVGWSLKDELDGAAIMHQGEGVIVGVFDTSPFLDPWDGAANGQEVPAAQRFRDPRGGAELLTIETQETVKWVNPTMDVEPLPLKVLYPTIVNTLTVTATDTVTAGMIYDVRDHGLFVAGLVHAVAPASELRLIKVLNEYGCGDLFTLNTALGYFISDVVEEREQAEREHRPFKGIVINLSLGAHAPRKGISLERCERGDPENTDIVSLCQVLSDAVGKGIVVVAAAGNDSGEENELPQPRPQQIPAAYDFVIGVKASNRYGNLACFSNEGDVTAPGGDGSRANNCAHKIAGCSDDCSEGESCPDDCKEDIISLVLFPPNGNAHWPTHYGYWRGTSFSAPLVSGLAALALQAGAVPADEGNVPVGVDPALPSVADVIECSAASTSGGVISVPNALTDCLP